MAWFKRTKKGINTLTEDKKDVPKGLWYKSPTGKIVDAEELEKNFYVSPEDGYHVRIGSKEYFEILFDDNKFKELDTTLTSKDPLKFEDKKKYADRLKDASLSLSAYFFLSSNFKGSLDVRVVSSSLNLLSSNKISKYSLLPIRTWYPSSGLT